MLQGNNDTDSLRTRNLGFHAPSHANRWLRRNHSSDYLKRHPGNKRWRMGHIHLVGDGDVPR